MQVVLAGQLLLLSGGCCLYLISSCTACECRVTCAMHVAALGRRLHEQDTHAHRLPGHVHKLMREGWVQGPGQGGAEDVAGITVREVPATQCPPHTQQNLDPNNSVLEGE